MECGGSEEIDVHQSRADDKKPGQKLTGRSYLDCEATSLARRFNPGGP
jgi:hypothetical protein